ncbi:hypothetical protein PVL29_011813 [Vitis rotundifolia]|uniref:Uncharacterized protein n=1 Tax=Vitis rotundifolia TaxID=103349 RepID=A0AA39DQY5_VITRO|nr:hypothetical protein PVL29_011813 [Vitis rotundifolia]
MIHLGVHRALVVSNCEAVKECFSTNDKAFASRLSSTLWHEMHKLSMMEILSISRLDTYKHMEVSELDISIKDLY